MASAQGRHTYYKAAKIEAETTQMTDTVRVDPENRVSHEAQLAGATAWGHYRWELLPGRVRKEKTPVSWGPKHELSTYCLS